ncbi:MAG: S8 family peptidase [Planctomycetota bacterium]
MKRLGVFVFCLAVFSSAVPARADLAGYLDIIEYDKVIADPVFSTLTGAGQTIVVIDTGVDRDHVSLGIPFVTSRVITGQNFVTSADPPRTPPSPNYVDGQGHGTFVASVAAGRLVEVETTSGSRFDVSGIAPGANVISLRVLDNSGSGSFASILSALQWVSANVSTYNISALNMSLGTTSTFVDPDELINNSTLAASFSAELQGLLDMGVFVVAASGNSGDQSGLSFPAILNEAVSVGATDLSDNVASFTNRNNFLDLLAPGVGIWGADAALTPGDLDEFSYRTGSGTSFAAPQVAGAAVLLREYADRLGIDLTPAQILEALQNGGQEIVDGANTFKRLDVYGALVQVPEPGMLALCLALLPALAAVGWRHAQRRRSV